MSTNSANGSPLLSEVHVHRLAQFFRSLGSDAYPEPLSQKHAEITQEMMGHLFETWPPPEGGRVLDVGCGQGVALEHFRAKRLHATGITLNLVDVEVCRQRGFDVLTMDQSFLDFPDAYFDMLWCRHCLEHSVLPYYTLHEFHRVLKPRGTLFVEVPAPDTSCQHQSNRNHYSVLGKSMWMSLIKRSGFELLETVDINLTVPAGPDLYWAFFARRSN